MPKIQNWSRTQSSKLEDKAVWENDKNPNSIVAVLDTQAGTWTNPDKYDGRYIVQFVQDIQYDDEGQIIGESDSLDKAKSEAVRFMRRNPRVK